MESNESCRTMSANNTLGIEALHCLDPEARASRTSLPVLNVLVPGSGFSEALDCLMTLTSSRFRFCPILKGSGIESE